MIGTPNPTLQKKIMAVSLPTNDSKKERPNVYFWPVISVKYIDIILIIIVYFVKNIYIVWWGRPTLYIIQFSWITYKLDG